MALSKDLGMATCITTQAGLLGSESLCHQDDAKRVRKLYEVGGIREAYILFCVIARQSADTTTASRIGKKLTLRPHAERAWGSAPVDDPEPPAFRGQAHAIVYFRLQKHNHRIHYLALGERRPAEFHRLVKTRITADGCCDTKPAIGAQEQRKPDRLKLVRSCSHVMLSITRIIWHEEGRLLQLRAKLIGFQAVRRHGKKCMEGLAGQLAQRPLIQCLDHERDLSVRCRSVFLVDTFGMGWSGLCDRFDRQGGLCYGCNRSQRGDCRPRRDSF